jgi:hypothetical protein
MKKPNLRWSRLSDSESVGVPDPRSDCEIDTDIFVLSLTLCSRGSPRDPASNEGKVRMFTGRHGFRKEKLKINMFLERICKYLVLPYV